MEILQPEHSEVIEWLATKHNEKKADLSEAEDFLKRNPKIDEAKALVMRLKKSVGYYTFLLNLVKTVTRDTPPEPQFREYIPESRENSDFSSTFNFLFGHDELDEDDELDEENDEKEIKLFEDEEKLVPRDFIKPEFKEMTQETALLKLLESYDEPRTSTEVAESLYETTSGEDFKRARSSIAVALRVGAEQGKWKKVGRGIFASHRVASDIQEEWDG
ncbi:MAG: hypothetical protein KME06_05090 [Kastovskya adunca ATA6-11-RM4]|jgi:hypothetical protein|nr:hypothetical protein [Kastovskya adunca ATA6-11-RM4]